MSSLRRPLASLALTATWLVLPGNADAQATDGVEVVLSASKMRAEVGDVVTFSLTIDNRTDRAFTTATSQPAYVRLSPARGVDVVSDSASAQIGEGAPFRPEVGGVSGSSRLVRFGPLEVPARSRATLAVRASIGVDTRPGRTISRATLVDGGGVVLAADATATIEVERGRGLESSVIVGRVFCDDDGDHQIDANERGVFGAVVFIDSGSFAVTDSAGLFHFSRVAEGTRRVKLDVDSVGADRVRGAPGRLLRLTPGLPGRANFPIDCKRVRVAGDNPLVTLSHASRSMSPADPRLEQSLSKRLVVDGDLLLLAISIDGEELALPSASVSASAPDAIRVAGAGGLNLKAAPIGGYGSDRPRFTLGFQPPAGVVATRWTFLIAEASTSVLTSREAPFFSLTGQGALPAAIDWDGRGSDGTVAKPDQLYVAQLVVFGSRAKIEAASSLVVFGIEYGNASQGVNSLTWNGVLFGPGPNGPTATAALTANIDSLVKTLAPGDAVEIGVHAGAVTSRIEALVSTQERADLIKALLLAAGLKTGTVVARGRGAAEPIATGAGSADKNRRVEIRVLRKASSHVGASVPGAMAIAASALIDGQPIEVDERGRFRWEGAVPTSGAVLIDVQAQDGRRAAIDVSLDAGKRRANPRARSVEVAVDLETPTVLVGKRQLDPRLLKIDVSISSSPGGTKRVLPLVPAGLEFRRGELVIEAPNGVFERLPVNSVTPLALPAGAAGATVRLVLELADGSRAYSPRRSSDDGALVGGRGDALVVNGVAWPVVDQRAKDEAPLGEGGAVLVDATRSTGQRALYIVVLDALDQSSGAVDESAVEDVATSAGRGKSQAVSRAELLASAASDFWLELPPAGSEIATRLPVRGQSRVGNRLTINGKSVTAHADGTFAAVIEIPAGLSELRVVSSDASGFRAELRWPIKGRDSSFFALGLGELIVSTSATERGLFGDTAYLAGMSPDTTLAAGPLLIHGRATLYLKGELSPSRGFKRVRFTAHLDTARRTGSAAFFEDVLNPSRDEPTFGDSAIEVRDANGRGKIYARVDADESHAIVGAIAAELGEGELFRYGRTIDGAGVSIERELGASRVELDAFGATHAAESQRDHVVYRSTGGTLYYLRFGDVLEGSELIRIIVRGRDSGLIASERQLRRNVDYTIDYISGRIWLLTPVASSEGSGHLLSNSDANLAPDGGDPVYLEARYEHRGGPGTSERAAGFEARYGIGDFQLSAGAAGEWRDDEASGDYRLWGARATYAPGARSKLTAELAGARRREGDVEISIDGGLSFRDLAWAEPLENPRADDGQAWSVGAHLAGGDFFPALERTTVVLYAKQIDREFSASGSELERGRFKLGASVVTGLGDDDDVVVRHQADIADVPRIGPTANDIPAADPFILDERATYLTAVGWVGRRGAFTHQVEAAHHRLTSTAAREGGMASLDARRLGLGGRSTIAVSEQLSLSAFQEVWRGVRDVDPVLSPIDPASPSTRESDPLAGITSGVGIGWRLLPDATLTSELRQRWNGDQSASVGLRAKLSEVGSFYVAERAVRTDEGPTAVTVIGADDRFGPGGMGRSYGEYQIENTSSGARNRAVLGLGQRWNVTDVVGLGVGFEHQQVFGGFLPDGTPVGNNQRNLVRGSLDIAFESTLRMGVMTELRADRAARGGDIDSSLIDSDPRDPSGDGFPDHGGVAPGAPLVLQTGETTQVVASAGLSWRPEEGVSLFGRVRGARTWSGPAIGFTEVTTGLAYRSLLDDRLALLLRYTFLSERRPEATALEREQAHILAAVPVADLTKRWRLSGKLAFKRSVASGGLAEESSINATLAVARLGYRFFGNWDATGEARGLFLGGDNRELKLGTLAELGYSFDEFFRFGLGYNFSHFNDQELGDLTRDAHGLFARLTAEL